MNAKPVLSRKKKVPSNKLASKEHFRTEKHNNRNKSSVVCNQPERLGESTGTLVENFLT